MAKILSAVFDFVHRQSRTTMPTLITVSNVPKKLKTCDAAILSEILVFKLDTRHGKMRQNIGGEQCPQKCPKTSGKPRRGQGEDTGIGLVLCCVPTA